MMNYKKEKNELDEHSVISILETTEKFEK